MSTSRAAKRLPEITAAGGSMPPDRTLCSTNRLRIAPRPVLFGGQFVIASEAKHPAALEKELDCFVANAPRNEKMVLEDKTGRGAIRGRFVQ